MKKRIALLLSAFCILAFSACGEKEEEVVYVEPVVEEIPVEEEEPVVEEVIEEETEDVIPEGMYLSELTNEPIDEALMNQRPIAVMVDNEKFALPHFGVNSADVVYEIMNSTANDRITRLMVIMKDWKNIQQLGSVRSTRPTNFMLAAEWNAILIHDGGPFYNDQYYAKDYVNNLSGGFARFSNGKATEYTEYVTSESYTNADKGKTYDGLEARIEQAKYSKEYNEFYEGPHFLFAKGGVDLSQKSDAVVATNVSLPFYHNASQLKYNETTGLYEYYEYGSEHVDALTNEVTAFKNVILQSCSFAQLDENGYLIYNVIGPGTDGYYLTDGYAIPIAWGKASETAITKYYNKVNGEEIEINTGKTYIAIVPDDTWGEVTLQ